MGELFEAEFLPRLKRAAEEGLLLFAKYALVIALAYLVINFTTNVIAGAANGNLAAQYLNQLQQKGYLPQLVNGAVPDKPKVQ